MSQKNISQWIAGLGQTFHELVSNGVMTNEALTPSPKEGSVDDFISKPTPGIELWFQANAMKLERIVVTLKARMTTISTYRGELPPPFTFDMTQPMIRAKLGAPYQSGEPIKMPLHIGLTGGWDAYRLHRSIHPNAEVAVQCLADRTVSGLAFCFIDPGPRG